MKMKPRLPAASPEALASFVSAARRLAIAVVCAAAADAEVRAANAPPLRSPSLGLPPERSEGVEAKRRSRIEGVEANE